MDVLHIGRALSPRAPRRKPDFDPQRAASSAEAWFARPIRSPLMDITKRRKYNKRFATPWKQRAEESVGSSSPQVAQRPQEGTTRALVGLQRANEPAPPNGSTQQAEADNHHAELARFRGNYSGPRQSQLGRKRILYESLRCQLAKNRLEGI